METVVINLQMVEGALGSGVSLSCFSMLGYFVIDPTPTSPWAPEQSFILIYELPHSHSALLYHLCIDPSRSTRSSAAVGEPYAQTAIGGGIGVCVECCSF